MVVKKIMCILTLCQLIIISQSARILAVLPVPIRSHQMVFRVLTQELAKRGHELTVVTAFPIYENISPPVNYTEIDIREAVNPVVKHLITEEIKIYDSLFSQFVSTFNATNILYDKIFKLKGVQDLIKYNKRHFDLIFLEDCAKPLLILSEVFHAPIIQISSFGGTFDTFEIVGALTNPFIYPLAIRTRYHGLSMWEKIMEMDMEYRLKKAQIEAETLGREIIKKHLEINMPNEDKLKDRVHMVFLNIHPIWDSNRPVPPNVIYLGGLHQKLQQPLPKDLKTLIDSSVNGVIYVSFGTNINPSLLPLEKIQIFINVFSKLKYDIYWKWNNDNMTGLTSNIKVLKWFPQADLLRHPKVKLFITQGGLQSTDEAITGGVPLIGIPMIWDQFYNVNKYVHLGIGLHLDINSITETKLRDAIDTVLGDKRYKENIIELHSVLRDQIESPLERAVWWTEYVLRNKGAKHLRAPTSNMSWVEYYEVKLVLFVLTITVFIFVILSSILLLTLRRLLRMFLNKIKTD